MVPPNQGDPRLYIEISGSGEVFCWRRRDEVQYPADDPAGAAAQVAEYLKVLQMDQGDGG